MADWSAFSFLLVPTVTLGTIGLLVLVLRWGSAGSPSRSVAARRPQAGPPDAYGLLVAVFTPGSYVEGEALRRRLAEDGLRASVAITDDGPRLMVWPEDEERARDLLRQRS